MDGPAEGTGRGPRQMAGAGAAARGSFRTGARDDRAGGVAMRNVTVIDPRRGLRPRPAPRAAVLAHLKELQAKAANRDALGIVELALTGEFAGQTAVVSSF